ncbi:hypothetical protein ACNF49_40755 [Actinomadura sp. ATCC 39365]
MAGDALTASPSHVSGSEIQKLLNAVGAATGGYAGAGNIRWLSGGKAGLFNKITPNRVGIGACDRGRR